MERDYKNMFKKKEGNKNVSMRDLLKITRKLNEDTVEVSDRVNMKTGTDEKTEESKFLNNVDDLNVNVDFIPLEVYDDYVFWGGTVDGMLQFIYKVTDDESTSGTEFNYLEDFNKDNPDNIALIKRIETYYDSFYKYWRDNLLQK